MKKIKLQLNNAISELEMDPNNPIFISEDIRIHINVESVLSNLIVGTIYARNIGA